MAEILHYNGITKGHIPPKQVLEHAAHDDTIEATLIISITKDGALVAAASEPDEEFNIYLVEKFKYLLLSGTW